MYACYDEQGKIHYTNGRVALCGCRSLIEAVHHDLDGTETVCKPCKKAMKRAAASETEVHPRERTSQDEDRS